SPACGVRPGFPGAGAVCPAATRAAGDDVAHHARQARPLELAGEAPADGLVLPAGFPAALVPRGLLPKSRAQLGAHLRAHVQALVHPLQILALALLEGPVAPRAGKEREHRRADDTHE